MLSLMKPTQLLTERSDNLGIGCWVLVIGYWVLGVGYWVLGVGCINYLGNGETIHYSLFHYSLIITLHRIYKTLFGFIKNQHPHKKYCYGNNKCITQSPNGNLPHIQQHVTGRFYDVSQRIIMY